MQHLCLRCSSRGRLYNNFKLRVQWKIIWTGLNWRWTVFLLLFKLVLKLLVSKKYRSGTGIGTTALKLELLFFCLFFSSLIPSPRHRERESEEWGVFKRLWTWCQMGCGSEGFTNCCWSAGISITSQPPLGFSESGPSKRRCLVNGTYLKETRIVDVKSQRRSCGLWAKDFPWCPIPD